MRIKSVLILDGVDYECALILEQSHILVRQFDSLPNDSLIQVIQDYDALVVRSATKVTEEVIAAGKRLKLIARAGAGVDNIDVEAAKTKNIVVINSPVGNTIAVAELVCGLMLCMARNIPRADATMKQFRWCKADFCGQELGEKTLGIVGFGKVGKEVAKRMIAFGMKIVTYDPAVTEQTNELSSEGIQVMGFDSLLETADYITVHVPLLPSTKNMINKEALAKCKDGVRIVDCSRGGITNGADLVEALHCGKVAGAALDVYEQEPPTNQALICSQKVICTPHIGGSTNEAQRRIAVNIANQIVSISEE